jgi:deoxyhypusine synthase
MLMEWLEPSIENGIDKTFELYVASDKYKEINKKFMEIINELDNRFGIGSKLPELENLFWSANASSIEYAYRTSFVTCYEFKSNK